MKRRSKTKKSQMKRKKRKPNKKLRHLYLNRNTDPIKTNRGKRTKRC